MCTSARKCFRGKVQNARCSCVLSHRLSPVRFSGSCFPLKIDGLLCGPASSTSPTCMQYRSDSYFHPLLPSFPPPPRTCWTLWTRRASGSRARWTCAWGGSTSYGTGGPSCASTSPPRCQGGYSVAVRGLGGASRGEAPWVGCVRVLCKQGCHGAQRARGGPWALLPTN